MWSADEGRGSALDESPPTAAVMGKQLGARCVSAALSAWRLFYAGSHPAIASSLQTMPGLVVVVIALYIRNRGPHFIRSHRLINETLEHARRSQCGIRRGSSCGLERRLQGFQKSCLRSRYVLGPLDGVVSALLGRYEETVESSSAHRLDSSVCSASLASGQPFRCRT